jgi:hypothetical protein
MNETLRPSTLGEILDRTAQLYRGNFWLFAGTAALPFGAMIAVILVGIILVPVVALVFKGSMAVDINVIRVGAGAVAVVFALPIYLAAVVYSAAGITQAAISTHRGEKLTIRWALRTVSPRFWRYFGLLLLQGLMAGLVPGVLAGTIIFGLIFLGSRAGFGTAAGIGVAFLVFVVGGAAVVIILWLALSYAMGMAVCVAEQKLAWESLQRAMTLSKGTRLRIFVMFLLLTVLSIAVSMVSYIVSLLIASVASLVGASSTIAAVAAVVGGVLYFAVSVSAQIVIQPVSWIALVLFYYDQRIRKEGFDIEWMMERAGMTAPPPAPPGPTPPAPLPPMIEGDTISSPGPPPDTVEER